MEFITAPTMQQRREIENLYDKGLSDSYVSCYVQAPLQAINVVALAAIDIPKEVLRGCFNWTFSVITGKFSKAATLLGLGILDALRSLAQIALVVMSVALGIFFPRFSYSSLKALNGPLIAQDNARQVNEGLRTLQAQLTESARFRQQAEEANAKIESNALEIALLKQANLELEGNVATLKESLEQKESEVSSLNEEAALAKQGTAEVNLQLQQKESDFLGLNEQVTLAKQEASQANLLFETTARELENLKGANERLLSEKKLSETGFSRQLKEKDSEISRLQSQILNLEASAKGENKENNSNQEKAKMAKLQRQVDRTEQRKALLQNDMSNFLKEIKNTNVQNTSNRQIATK